MNFTKFILCIGILVTFQAQGSCLGKRFGWWGDGDHEMIESGQKRMQQEKIATVAQLLDSVEQLKKLPQGTQKTRKA